MILGQLRMGARQAKNAPLHIGSFIWLDCNQFFIFEVLSRLMGVILLSSIFELFMIRWILSFIFRSFTRKDGNSQGLLVFLFIFYPIK